MPKRVFIIIPCFQEEAVLRNTVQELLPLGHEIVVVDDGSTPSARPLLQGLPVHFLRHAVNLGQGAALQTGMEFARKNGADAVVHFDADGQHAPSDIQRFLAELQNGADIVLGSRFLRNEDLAAVPAGKRLLLRIARIVNGIFTGMWLSDAHNGFRALGTKALTIIELKENRMAHATEILTQIRKAGLICREIPVTIRYTDYSKAKGQKWTNSLNILIDIILNKFM